MERLLDDALALGDEERDTRLVMPSGNFLALVFGA
jgi:hypothetical protein